MGKRVTCMGTLHPRPICLFHFKNLDTAAARLAQLGERRSTDREVANSNPDRTNTQGLKNN